MTANARKFTFPLPSAASMSASRPGLLTNETDSCLAVCISLILSCKFEKPCQKPPDVRTIRKASMRIIAVGRKPSNRSSELRERTSGDSLPKFPGFSRYALLQRDSVHAPGSCEFRKARGTIPPDSSHYCPEPNVP